MTVVERQCVACGVTITGAGAGDYCARCTAALNLPSGQRRLNPNELAQLSKRHAQSAMQWSCGWTLLNTLLLPHVSKTLTYLSFACFVGLSGRHALTVMRELLVLSRANDESVSAADKRQYWRGAGWSVLEVLVNVGCGLWTVYYIAFKVTAR